jgi:hypothetical protein
MWYWGECKLKDKLGYAGQTGTIVAEIEGFGTREL